MFITQQNRLTRTSLVYSKVFVTQPNRLARTSSDYSKVRIRVRLMIKLKSSQPSWLGYLVPEHMCHKWPWTLVVNTSRSFRHSWLITGFVSRVTRRVPLVLLDLYYYVQYFVDRCLSFCTFFFLAFVLCVLLWFMYSGYHFYIFKLFLVKNKWQTEYVM